MGIKIPPLLLLFYAFLIALRPGGFHSLVQIPGSMPSPRPLCASQFTLVNYACSTLPLSPLPGASPIDDLPIDPFPDSDYEIPDHEHDHHRHHSNSPSHHRHGHHHSSSSAHGHGRDHSPSKRSHHHHENHDHRSRHRSEHRHHDDREHRHHDDGEHRHRHRHEHRHHRHRHSQEDECCRWLQQVDPQCVCNVLVHLPTFLSRPNHIYTAVVGDSCNVTFACGGRLRP